MMQLTYLQLQHYDTFGFLVIRDFLDEEIIESLRTALNRMKTDEPGETDTLKHTGRVYCNVS